MQKGLREIIRMAREYGVENIGVQYGKGTHFWLTGTVNGQPFRLHMSMTKMAATDRHQCGTRLNLRRAIREHHERYAR